MTERGSGAPSSPSPRNSPSGVGTATRTTPRPRGRSSASSGPWPSSSPSAGIRVNAVAPGPTDTPLLESSSPWRDPAYLATLPARRLVTPEEVAVTARLPPLIEEDPFLLRRGHLAQRRGGDLGSRLVAPSPGAAGRGSAGPSRARLAADGAQILVAVSDRSRPARRLDLLAKEIGGFAVPADVADPAAVREGGWPRSRNGPAPRSRCSSPTRAYMTMAPFGDHGDDDWWKIIDTNLAARSIWSRRCWRACAARRRQHRHRRLRMGRHRLAEATAYAASKAGLIALTKTLGRELAPEHITVNAIAPGVIDTPQLQVDADDAGELERDARAVRARIPRPHGSRRNRGGGGPLAREGHGRLRRPDDSGQRRDDAVPDMRRTTTSRSGRSTHRGAPLCGPRDVRAPAPPTTSRVRRRRGGRALRQRRQLPARGAFRARRGRQCSRVLRPYNPRCRCRRSPTSRWSTRATSLVPLTTSPRRPPGRGRPPR